MTRLRSWIRSIRARADASAILPSELPGGAFLASLPWEKDVRQNFAFRLCIYLGRRDQRRAFAAGAIALALMAGAPLLGVSYIRCVESILLASCAALFMQLIVPALVIRRLFGSVGFPRTDLRLSLASPREIAVGIACWTLSRRNLRLLRALTLVALTGASCILVFKFGAQNSVVILLMYVGSASAILRYPWAASRMVVQACIASLADPDALFKIGQPAYGYPAEVPGARLGWGIAPQFAILVAIGSLSALLWIPFLRWIEELVLAGVSIGSILYCLRASADSQALNDFLRTIYMIETLVRRHHERYDDDRPGRRISAEESGVIDCSGEDWSGLKFPRSDLRGLDLRRATFAGSDFTGSNFGGADLAEARLDRTTLDHATFPQANLDGASLRGASLAEARLGGSTIRNADFTGANLAGASLDTCAFEDCDFGDANLAITGFYGTRLTRCDLSRTRSLSVRQIARAKLGEGVKLPPGINDAAIAAYLREQRTYKGWN